MNDFTKENLAVYITETSKLIGAKHVGTLHGFYVIWAACRDSCGVDTAKERTTLLTKWENIKQGDNTLEVYTRSFNKLYSAFVKNELINNPNYLGIDDFQRVSKFKSRLNSKSSELLRSKWHDQKRNCNLLNIEPKEETWANVSVLVESLILEQQAGCWLKHHRTGETRPASNRHVRKAHIARNPSPTTGNPFNYREGMMVVVKLFSSTYKWSVAKLIESTSDRDRWTVRWYGATTTPRIDRSNVAIRPRRTLPAS